MGISGLLDNYAEAIAMILFVIGFMNLLLQHNLIKKIIGFNIMDSSIFLFLAEYERYAVCVACYRQARA